MCLIIQVTLNLICFFLSALVVFPRSDSDVIMVTVSDVVNISSSNQPAGEPNAIRVVIDNHGRNLSVVPEKPTTSAPHSSLRPRLIS